MANSEVILLKSSLEILSKTYSVKLTSSEIYWEAVSTSIRAPASGPYSEPLVKTENQTVKLCDIIGVHCEKPEVKHEGKFQSVELKTLNPTSFSVWVIKKVAKHRWRERKLTFNSRDTHIIQQWVDKIQEILCKPEYHRPKSLLVFINPYGGKGKASQLFHQKAAPMFDLAKVNYDAITTLRANHARDTLQEYDLSKVDGIVCIGGDGMFVEILHGIMARTHRDNGMGNPGPNTPLLHPKLRLGIIPAGSTNAVAYSIHGTDDATTAALHIVVGDSVAMDVATVHHGNQFLKYNVSLMGYGYFGDSLIDSDQNRWMGPKRYDWAGMKKLLGNRAYEGEVSFLLSPDKENHPQDRTFCKAGCTICAAVANDLAQDQEIDITTKEEDDDEHHPTSDTQLLNNNKISDSKWQTIRGRFISVNSYLINCRCHFSPEGPAPSAHLGDGCLDLIIVKDCDRVDFFKHLYRCSKPHKDQFDFPFVQVVRVKEYKFRTLADDMEDSHDASELDGGQQRLRSRSQFTSTWNCDGETIEEASVDVRAHQQVLKLFGRGIEEEPKHGHKCFPCTCIKT